MRFKSKVGLVVDGKVSDKICLALTGQRVSTSHTGTSGYIMATIKQI